MIAILLLPAVAISAAQPPMTPAFQAPIMVKSKTSNPPIQSWRIDPDEKLAARFERGATAFNPVTVKF